MEQERLLRLKSIGPVRGDETSIHYYELTGQYTVKQLCDYIVSNPRTWGYIGIKKTGTLFGEPCIEYYEGKYVDGKRNPIEFNFPENIANSIVKDVEADGGWGRLDFVLVI